MKCLSPFTLALMASAVLLSGGAKAAVYPTLDLTLEEVLRLPKTRAAVYSPVKLNVGDSLSFTALQLDEVPARSANVFRGSQIKVFAVDPDTGGYTATVLNFVVPVSTGPIGAPTRSSSGLSAGKVSMTDLSYSALPEALRFADGSVRILIVAIGIEAANQGATPKPAPLPKELSLTNQLDQQDISLLLPAVQKVREAAR